ncbi:hypothetical protein GCM10027285_23100 [Oleiagrimonas citrea]|uniref:Integrase n=1 Tax=Oleiagrimonas citrea TaxID=1665687 RepID=A0A846ZHN4_9GAMM|nr:DNA-binding protein [Oleiagrimonas citrea]NKZ37377.1 integrase [Oleiagrimonas citrea]
MPRGITQDQVNDAADSILSKGENPTVEKVRAELGTGSPNTITRMLNTWRRVLGERLQQLTTLPELPAPVGQAMIELWRLATEHAEQAIAERFANERTQLESTQAELALERESWQERLKTAEADVEKAKTAQSSAEQARASLEKQLSDSHAVRADLVQQRDRLQDLCDQQAQQIKELQKQLDEQQKELREDRAQQEIHLRNIEDRAHQETDRARQESKQWQRRFELAERAHRDAIADLQEQRDQLHERLQSAEHELARCTGQIAGLEKALSKRRTAATRRPKSKAASKKAPVKATRSDQRPRRKPAK